MRNELKIIAYKDLLKKLISDGVKKAKDVDYSIKNFDEIVMDLTIINQDIAICRAEIDKLLKEECPF